MSDKRVTLVISDLHVGGGPADPGDDHVHHKDQFAKLLHEQLRTPEGRAGDIELLVNGDFLEFAQTDTDAFSLRSDKCWCTEPQSLRKLETIMSGHGPIFGALRDFQHAGNHVTLAAGNHDVDLYWPGVQQRLRDVVGAELRFEVGREWVERHNGMLQVGHGHMSDVANRFRNWARPVVRATDGTECLEMCPGTLFMVKFVNGLEAHYPFADNLLPVTKLASVLLADDRAGFRAIGWMFTRFVATADVVQLGVNDPDPYGQQLLASLRNSRERSRQLVGLLDAAGLAAAARRAERRLDEETLAESMFALLGRIDEQSWCALFELPPAATLGADGEVTLTAIIGASFVDGKLELRKAAQKRAALKPAQVVVMGHTHQLDSVVLPNGTAYHNPGSWTRYLELARGQRVRLDDLRQEARYPYNLNVVRVERHDDCLRSEMVCVDRGP